MLAYRGLLGAFMKSLTGPANGFIVRSVVSQTIDAMDYAHAFAAVNVKPTLLHIVFNHIVGPVKSGSKQRVSC